MYLLSYLFFTFSLLNVLILISQLIEPQKNQQAIKRSGQMILFSFSWGLLFYAIVKDWAYPWLALQGMISVFFSYFIYQDWVFLYFTDLWKVDLKDPYLKKIVYYYNPRIYWMLFVGVTFLGLYFFTQLLSIHWAIVGFSFFIVYYAGLFSLQDRMKEFNAFAVAVSTEKWSELSDVKIKSKFIPVLYLRTRGLEAYPKLKDIWSKLKQAAPVLEKYKLELIENYYENENAFLLELMKKNSFSLFSSEDKISILEKIPHQYFLELYAQLLPKEVRLEEFKELKINHLLKEQKWSEAEKELLSLEDSEFKDLALDEVFKYKSMLIEMFDYSKFSTQDFEISDEDYLRPSAKDRYFLKKYKMELFSLFDNRCCASGVREEIEIDHFFIPKSKGGSFLMKHKLGFWVVNAVILNKKNNIIKNNKRIEDFFDIATIMEINLKLKQINFKINDDYALLD